MTNMQPEQHPVRELYGTNDLGSDPLFPGGYINYGYWENLPPSADPIRLEDRVRSQANMYRMIWNAAQIGQDDIVLEVGCGKGQGLRLLHDEIRPNGLYGVDFSEHQVVRARATLADVPGAAYVLQAPAEELPFQEDTFTRALCVEAIQHFASPEAFVHQLGRVVRASGAVAITSFFATNKDKVPELKQMFPNIKNGTDHAIDIGDMSGWFKDAGFRNMRIVSIGNMVWEQFVKWRNQVRPDNPSTKWLDAYKQGLLDYYVITATKGL